jgi:hypothetical protein
MGSLGTSLESITRFLTPPSPTWFELNLLVRQALWLKRKIALKQGCKTWEAAKSVKENSGPW